MFLAAGQMRGRLERLNVDARMHAEVMRARPDLGLSSEHLRELADPRTWETIHAAFVPVGNTAISHPLTTFAEKLTPFKDPFATLTCEAPAALPALVPPPSEPGETQSSLELPPFQLSDLREYFSVITFLTPSSAIKGPLSEPEDEARVTIGDEEELRTVLQAIGPEISTTAGVLIMFVGIPSLLGILFGAAHLIEMSHKKKLQLEHDRIAALRMLLLDGVHTSSYDEIFPALHDTRKYKVPELFTENIAILTNSAAYQNPNDPEHVKVLVRILDERYRGLQAKMLNPEIQHPAASRELDELQQLVATTQFEDRYFNFQSLKENFSAIGITPDSAMESNIDRLRANAAAQRAQETRAPAKAKAGKPE